MVQLPCSACAQPVSSNLDSKYDQLRQELANEVKPVVQCRRRSAAVALPRLPPARMTGSNASKSASELRLQGEKFEGWFQKFGQQAASSNQQIQEVASTVASQQKELQHVRAEVSQQAKWFSPRYTAR